MTQSKTMSKLISEFCFLVFFSYVCLLSPSGFSTDFSETFTASAQKAPDISFDDLKPVGKASLRVLWFDIYDATLLTTTGYFSDDALEDFSIQESVNSFPVHSGPMALELVYKRNIRSKSLLAETKKQLNGKLDDNILTAGLTQLESIWPNITKKDALTFYLANDSLGYFYHNSNYLGSVEEENFARAIGQDCQYPKLADQLKGLK